MDRKTKNIIAHIGFDYKAILNYMKTCLNNKLDYSSYMGVMPFFCMYVLEGYKCLTKKQLIDPDLISKKDLAELDICRAKGTKLYVGFKQSTFDSINKFNRDEYIKFYKKAFPQSSPKLLSFVDNYFICCTDEFPVGNYHLYSKKVLDMEIGSYIPDVSQRVYNRAYLLANFSSKIVSALDAAFDCNSIGKCNVDIKFNYTDLNMAYDYSNFRIKKVPPILMAFLDILCVLNSYRKIFTTINGDNVFDVKVKYVILTHSILSLRDIIGYCDANEIDIQIDDAMRAYILELDKRYVKNEPRRFCMHYDFPDFEWRDDYFVEKFEQVFEKSFNLVSEDLSAIVEELSTRLQNHLIIRNFL